MSTFFVANFQKTDETIKRNIRYYNNVEVQMTYNVIYFNAWQQANVRFWNEAKISAIMLVMSFMGNLRDK